ncbi:MAG: hypothetical protein FWF75_03120 [Propionibacteriaceae bacterium]|nr:hypothetical protein [Propionibacteriaceae bacterium]
MINGVFDVTPAQYHAIRADFAKTPDVFIGEADGRLICDNASFYRVIGTAMGAPADAMGQITNQHWFYDEMTTLYWFEDAQGNQRYQQYVLAVTHPDEIRQDTRWGYREMFENLAQFWGDGVVRYVVDGQARGFAVYLVR